MNKLPLTSQQQINEINVTILGQLISKLEIHAELDDAKSGMFEIMFWPNTGIYLYISKSLDSHRCQMLTGIDNGTLLKENVPASVLRALSINL